jgi:hypothetical protein
MVIMKSGLKMENQNYNIPLRWNHLNKWVGQYIYYEIIYNEKDNKID